MSEKEAMDETQMRSGPYPDATVDWAHSQGMIEPPSRGDRFATGWLIAGVVLYAVLALVFVGGLLTEEQDVAEQLLELVGLGEARNWSLFVLVFGGVILTMVATLTVAFDVKRIKLEEDDIDWILLHGREGAPLVLAAHGEREERLRRGELSMPTGPDARVETLIDDRVRRAHSVLLRGGVAAIPVEELRIIAERRTARWGAFARYASSLLLLLAVLGTFAGVKTALPQLIEAVAETGARLPGEEQSSRLSASATTAASSVEAPASSQAANLTGSLQAVSDAFGGNALALIGAIAVGLMAQGIGVGRRHLLERLELASDRYIYGDNSANSADPLRAAIHTLSETAQEIRNSSGALLGIEGGLEALGVEFKSAIRSLDDRLTQILHHQESGLYERTASVLEELQNRISSMSAVLDANTRLYAGLVDGIGERAAQSNLAISELQKTNVQLAQALEGTVRLGEAATKSRESLEGSSKLLVDSTVEVSRHLEGVSVAVAELGPGLVDVQTALRDTANRVQRIDEQSAIAWAKVGEQVGNKLEELAVAIERTPNSSGHSRHTDALLQQIVRNTMPGGSGRTPRWELALLPLTGTLSGIAVIYLLARFGLL